jgi:hypothetical protein
LAIAQPTQQRSQRQQIANGGRPINAGLKDRHCGQ